MFDQNQFKQVLKGDGEDKCFTVPSGSKAYADSNKEVKGIELKCKAFGGSTADKA